MESTVAEEVSESPMAQEEVKNEATIIAGDDGNMENGKNPVLVAVVATAERYINEFNEVELCGLGMIPTVVTIAEILKRNGFAIQKGIMTSTVLSTQEDRKGRQIEKAKIEIVLGKAEKFGAMNAVVTPKKAAD
ncbi:hypothetical protein GOBAR_DD33120 [Gossypium barbadense]|nr:hypothetical protein GOBAR_DD33120 [Gossypium barbadense]